MNGLLNFSGGFYIEAGANNGINQSNTHVLETNHGWHGLLIEPNQIRLNECRANRSDKNHFEYCALVSPDHKESTISGNFAETDSALSLMAQVTVPLDYYDKHQRVAAIEKQSRKVVQVPAKTLQSLIDSYKISQIDFLSLDVEGYEYEAMKGLDFEKNPPRFLRIETSTLENRIADMRRFVEAKGYRFIGQPTGQGPLNDCFFAFN